MFARICLFVVISLSFCIKAEPESTEQHRIVGGDAVVNENIYPWMVSLQAKYRTGSNAHLCGGVLIAPQWVLTAAHCVEFFGYQNDLLRVVGNTVDLNNLGSQQSSAVELVYSHPNYDTATFDHDIALLYLAKPLNLPFITPISSSTYSTFNEMTSLQVMGWGTLAFESNSASSLLRETSLFFVRSASYLCRILLDSDNQMCAGDEISFTQRDSCRGDSGGPLIYDDGGIWRLVGLVSSGIGCADGFPGVYTKVVNYWDGDAPNLGWVASQVNGVAMNSPQFETVASMRVRSFEIPIVNSTANNVTLGQAQWFQNTDGGVFTPIYDPCSNQMLTPSETCLIEVDYQPTNIQESSSLRVTMPVSNNTELTSRVSILPLRFTADTALDDNLIYESGASSVWDILFLIVALSYLVYMRMYKKLI